MSSLLLKALLKFLFRKNTKANSSHALHERQILLRLHARRARVARVEVQSKQVGCPSWPTGKDVMTTSFAGRRSITAVITTVDKQLQQIPQSETALFRTFSPHQPLSGEKVEQSHKDNESEDQAHHPRPNTQRNVLPLWNCWSC